MEAHNQRLHSTAAAGQGSESQSKLAAAASEPQPLGDLRKFDPASGMQPERFVWRIRSNSPSPSRRTFRF